VTTFNELTDDVLSMLRGYVRSQESVTALNGSLDASATSFNVDNGSRLGMGRAEIDDELVYIDAITTNAVALQPWGRGVDGTTAATHADNARVTFNPLFPRFYVKRAINDTIQSMGVELKALDVTTFTFVAAKNTYELPSALKAANQVTWKTVGPSGRWETARRWQVDLQADTTQYTTGKTITVWDSIVPGRTVQVRYLKEPSNLSAGADTLESTTGFPASCRDVVALGTAARLVSSIDVALLDPSSVQAGFFDERRQIGSASNVARTLYALYQQRLAEEVARFRDNLNTPIHYRK
jgi:hypothetical protein